MKRLLAILLAAMFALSMVACGAPATQPAPAAPAEPGAVEPPAAQPSTDGTYEIALVTDVGNIDDKSFNQGAWEGVVAYAEANGKTYNYYRPSEDSDEARIETIRTAIDKGAKVVVCPGYLFATAIATLQGDYADVSFLGLDLGLGDIPEPTANTALITYQEEQAGYFAGYAAIKEGFTKLGFLGGMAVPAVVRFGYGFVQGANDAAKELDIVGDVSLKYWYSDSFAPTDDIKTKMSGWFTEGTEVVFACGGGIYLSAIAAAEEAGAKIIGVDRDQADDAELIITSAFKSLAPSVQMALEALYGNGGVWPAQYGGIETKLGAKEECVGLPTADTSWRLANYTVAEYQELYAKVQSGEVTVSASIDTTPIVDIAVAYQN
ncbi:MAG: BMP family ABC transporter substrate-binding protein [Christensenellaceae bacterium]|jgi:basic membrane protein A|nr:BMP family ABC transporter substrate-binding protein [Christensenellaceae bacterium]